LTLRGGVRKDVRVTLADEAVSLWDVDEADRFAKLAFRYPDLLTHEEQVRWKLVRENGALWQGHHCSPPSNAWQWTVDEQSFLFDRLRAYWPAFCSVAETGTGHEALPKWNKTAPFDFSNLKPKVGESTGPRRVFAESPTPQTARQTPTAPAQPPTPLEGSDDLGDDVSS